jgi:hypothetical protein
MNNNRLSELLQVDITKLLNEPSNYEIKDGRVFIKSLNRFKGSPGSKMVQLLEATNEDVMNTFSSIAEGAKFLDILPQTARIRVQKNTKFLFNGKLVYFKLVSAVTIN